MASAARSFFFVVGVGLLLCSITIGDCAEATPVAPPARPQPASTQQMAALLTSLVEKVNPLESTLLTGKAIELMRPKLAASTRLGELLPLKLAFGTLLLNDGQSAAALQQLEECEQLLAANHLPMPPDQRPKFLETKALCYLRLGEQENCLVNHNGDSCLIPIRGGGVHKIQRGSRGAITVLNELLEINPNPYAIWLLNLAYMTLGEYRDGVPPQWIMPPRVFESDYDIKRFPDVAGPLGVDVDDLAGGVVLEDFDHDGYLDFLVSGMGYTSPFHLFHNNGDGTFTERTKEAGLDGLMSGLNLVSGDYNNDGWVDVLVLRGGWQGNNGGLFPNSLLRNNGDGTFTDVTEEAGLLSFHPTQTAVWFDFDGDGWLDLFVGNESRADKGEIHPCELYRNNGNGTFTECAVQNGVAIVDFIKAVACGDYNNDGRPDLYLSSRDGPNHLLRNDGPAGKDAGGKPIWRFTDVAAAAGVQEPLHSFPAWFFDYDNDGWLDLFVTGYSLRDAGDVALDYLNLPHPGERARLYHNNHDGTFTDVSKATGLFKVIHAMGSNFGDLDNDGWLDIYAGTGDPYLGMLIPARMFRNDGGRNFQDVTTAGGFGQLQKGHGIAFGDINNDGSEDIYSVVGGAYPGDHYHNQLFANPGHGNHFLKISLEGVASNRLGFGARLAVTVKTPSGERTIHRVAGTGGSFGASPTRQEIGLGDAVEIVRLTIEWPRTGETQIVTKLQLDRTYVVREGDLAPREVTLKPFAWPAAGAAGEHHHHHAGAP